jgi:mRNA interferase RelE/StbE
LAWTVEISDVAQRQLRRLDYATQERILNYLNERIEGCKNPRHFGESLKSNLSGLWRYRVGDYRIICRIEEDRIVVLVLNIGHRKNIYT